MCNVTFDVGESFHPPSLKTAIMINQFVCHFIVHKIRFIKIYSPAPSGRDAEPLEAEGPGEGRGLEEQGGLQGGRLVDQGAVAAPESWPQLWPRACQRPDQLLRRPFWVGKLAKEFLAKILARNC